MVRLSHRVESDKGCLIVEMNRGEDLEDQLWENEKARKR